MFDYLTEITEKPDLYCCYTAEALWNDPYISGQMLKNHLNPSVDLASRRFDFIDESVAFIKERFKLGEGKAVIDFGCGPGLYTTRLARLGCTVRGLDFSSNSIDYARTEAARLGLDIEYLHLNYLEYQANKPFDLAAMIFCDYCVLNDEQRKTLLKIMKDSIKDDGFIFMDVCSDHMYQNIVEGTTFESQANGGFWSAQRHYVFKSTFKYDISRVSLEKYNVFEKDRNLEIFNWLKHFSFAELGNEFEENGLEILKVYSDVSGRPYDTASDTMALVMGKKSSDGK
ncbi:MAG: class I SAM-dependent methyltransferase [Syntrophomonas sp.]